MAGGVRNLPWLFTATFVVMLAVVPLFGAVVARLPRHRFIPLVYQFFVLNIAVFWVLLTMDVAVQTVARVFFVWLTVFNVFAVSVFWSFSADLYKSEQGKRLYGFIAAGGSAGALLGPTLTVWLAKPLGPVNLLIVAALFLEVAIFFASRLERAAPSLAAAAMPEAAGDAAAKAKKDDKTKLGGGWLDGLALLFGSRYLGGIGLWVVLLSLAGTFLYLMQADLVAAASDDPARRTQIFASIDLASGILQVLIQLLVTGRIIARFGVGAAVGFLPAVFCLGFIVLALSPALMVVVAFQAIQRTANFAVANPGREILFTVVGREEKYKAKNIIDVPLFRGADALWSWGFKALGELAGLGIAGLAWVMVPVTLGWIALAAFLGRTQERKAASLKHSTA